MSGRDNFRKLQAQTGADPERRTRIQRERKLTEAIIRLSALREARWGDTVADRGCLGHHSGKYLTD